MNRARLDGLTLVELLVTLGIIGLILNAVFMLLNGSIGTSQQLAARASATQEAQITQRLLAGRLNEALFVYDAGTAPSFDFGAGVTTSAAGLRAGSRAWTLGTDPILAMLLPPRAPGELCSSATSDGCHRFVAYYPLRRATLSGASISRANKPDVDPSNEDTWVLMEYRRNLYCSGVAWQPGYDTQGRFDVGTLPSVPCIQAGGVAARLLADYVRPSSAPTTGGFRVDVDAARKTATFTLAFQRTSGRHVLQVPPSAGSALQSFIMTVRPKNWF